MLPETFVVVICTLDQSGVFSCATATCPQTSATPTNARNIQVRICLLIQLLLRKPPRIVSLRFVAGEMCSAARAPRPGPGRRDSPLEVWLTITGPTPLFFVSVACKGLTITLSSLFATHTRGPGSVASKRLALHQIGARKAVSLFGDAAKTARGRPIGVAGVQFMQESSTVFANCQ